MAVTSLAFSPSHSSQLMSGSRDGGVRLWHFPEREGGGIVAQVTPPSVGIVWDTVAMAAGRSPSLVSIYEPPQVLEQWACHSAPPSQGGSQDPYPFQPEESFATADGREGLRAVERAIARRDLGTAFSQALATAKAHQTEGRYEAARAVLDLCYERSYPPPLTPGVSPDFDPVPLRGYPSEGPKAPKAVIEREMALYSYFLPPNSPPFGTEDDAEQLVGVIEQEKLMVELHLFATRGQAQDLLDRQQYPPPSLTCRDVRDLLLKDPTALPGPLLVRILKEVMGHEYLKALQWAEELTQVPRESWDEFVGLVGKLFLSPTLWDHLPGPPSQYYATAVIPEHLRQVRQVCAVLWRGSHVTGALVSLVTVAVQSALSLGWSLHLPLLRVGGEALLGGSGRSEGSDRSEGWEPGKAEEWSAASLQWGRRTLEEFLRPLLTPPPLTGDPVGRGVGVIVLGAWELLRTHSIAAPQAILPKDFATLRAILKHLTIAVRETVAIETLLGEAWEDCVPMETDLLRAAVGQATEGTVTVLRALGRYGKGTFDGRDPGKDLGKLLPLLDKALGPDPAPKAKLLLTPLFKALRNFPGT